MPEPRVLEVEEESDLRSEGHHVVSEEIVFAFAPGLVVHTQRPVGHGQLEHPREAIADERIDLPGKVGADSEAAVVSSDAVPPEILVRCHDTFLYQIV